ncbi:MAG: sulfite exporter TauE/SafE family protein [Candidatus Cloacimonetes bacterium]|nr:sulfite exporter TauE/SafE family protein [Candidatus Cloacimonadota bacterium]MCF7814522.1 sulfite exporter TauE/SafE family protein [Candidatus Cloacimonadota bacterium]MCF7867686.1 sulfite exporter TauE/SafE family protein [Candidatus Cloacimonadota bacterium]MCF7883516.1 sulfite exporter TauE/SafE family protein [Candidatus Cloacimonadota bacterium]
MSNEISLLAITAASIGFFHTLFGPDHYLPFIVMSKARGWSMPKTMSITFLCGLGHVLGSVVLGILGVSIGIALGKIEAFESIRGSIAGWALMSFGLVYMLWGIRNAIRNRSHSHLHFHSDGSNHEHEHTHQSEHSHIHDAKKKNITPWVLFTIFVLGPCEPLIPILMYPAAQNSISGLIFITAIFAITTISTMMIVVYVASLGLKMVFFSKLEKYTHALAGGIILLSGVAINFLGL